MDSQILAKIIAKALFYASIQASIGSVEQSSKFSVLNFSKDQHVLQRAADALRGYMIIGIIWTIATMLALYATNGWCGAWMGLLANLLMMGWIIISYIKAFKTAAKENNLVEPTVLSGVEWKILFILLAGGIAAMAYACTRGEKAKHDVAIF